MSRSAFGLTTHPSLTHKPEPAWLRVPPKTLSTNSNTPGSGISAIVSNPAPTDNPTMPTQVTSLSDETSDISRSSLQSPSEASKGSTHTADTNTTRPASPTSTEPPPRPTRNPLRRESSSSLSAGPIMIPLGASTNSSDPPITPPASIPAPTSSTTAPASWAAFLAQANTVSPSSSSVPDTKLRRRLAKSDNPTDKESEADAASTKPFNFPFALPPLPSHPPPPPPGPPSSVSKAKLQPKASPFVPASATRRPIVIKNVQGEEIDLKTLRTGVLPPTPSSGVFAPAVGNTAKIESEEERGQWLGSNGSEIRSDTMPAQVEHEPSIKIPSPSTTHQSTDVAPQSTGHDESAVDVEEEEEWSGQTITIPTLATSPPTAPLESGFPVSLSTHSNDTPVGPPPTAPPPTRMRRERSRRGSRRGDSANRTETTPVSGPNDTPAVGAGLATMSRTKSQGMTRTRSGAGEPRTLTTAGEMTRTRSSGGMTRRESESTGIARTRSNEPRRRPVPSNLDLSGLLNPGGASVAGMALCLADAKVPDDLWALEYPEGIVAPSKYMNEGLGDGKYKYDRDFLLQFRRYCTERPIGMEEYEGITIAQPVDPPPPRKRTRRRRSVRTDATPKSASIPPTHTLPVPPVSGSLLTPISPLHEEPLAVGTMPTTPVSATLPAPPPVSMNMGRTRSRGGRSRHGSDAPKLTTPTTASSSTTPTSFPMVRSTSHGSRLTTTASNSTSLAGLPPPSPLDRRSRSQRSRRRSNSTKNDPPPPALVAPGSIQDLKPLEMSANRWMPPSIGNGRSRISDQPAATGASNDIPPELVERKVKALLNKLTMEKFDSISDQIVQWANKSETETDGKTLQLVIQLVFDKATDEAAWSAMYASLCKKLLEQLSVNVRDESVKDKKGEAIVGGQLFRVYLLSRCQADFEKGWSTRETLEEQQSIAVAAAAEAHGRALGEVVFSDEYYALQKAKRRGLGLVKFIGELFKLGMLTERIMHRCILKLLDEPAEDDIESVCQLLKTVGASLSGPKGKGSMDMYFGRMKELSEDTDISQRIRFMLMDVIDLRAQNWVPKNQTVAPTTLAQIHQDAEKEAINKAGNSRPIPVIRNTSRRGQNRPDTAPKNDGWGPMAQSFGPSLSSTLNSTFKTDDPLRSPTPVKSTSTLNSMHSLSRLASEPGISRMARNPSEPGKSRSRRSGDNNNRQLNRRPSVDFAHLNAAVETASTGRKRLHLLPRTVTSASISPTMRDTVDVMPSSMVVANEEPPEMSEGRARAKIEEDVKEFLQIRDLDEAVEYFKALPSSLRYLLVDKFVSKMDLKEADIGLIEELFSKVSGTGICSMGAFEQGFAPTVEALDDITLDVPAAYAILGRLLRASGLPREAVYRLAGTINVYEQVLVHPRDKLMRAFDDA